MQSVHGLICPTCEIACLSSRRFGRSKPTVPCSLSCIFLRRFFRKAVFGPRPPTLGPSSWARMFCVCGVWGCYALRSAAMISCPRAPSDLRNFPSTRQYCKFGTTPNLVLLVALQFPDGISYPQLHLCCIHHAMYIKYIYLYFVSQLMWGGPGVTRVFRVPAQFLPSVFVAIGHNTPIPR